MTGGTDQRERYGFEVDEVERRGRRCEAERAQAFAGVQEQRRFEVPGGDGGEELVAGGVRTHLDPEPGAARDKAGEDPGDMGDSDGLQGAEPQHGGGARDLPAGLFGLVEEAPGPVTHPRARRARPYRARASRRPRAARRGRWTARRADSARRGSLEFAFAVDIGWGYAGLTAGLVCTGFGGSFALPALVGMVVGAAPAGTTGAAGGLLNAGRQIGATVGVAATGAFATVGSAIDARQMSYALVLPAVVCASAGAAVARRRRG
jgi:hypothetical protein